MGLSAGGMCHDVSGRTSCALSAGRIRGTRQRRGEAIADRLGLVVPAQCISAELTGTFDSPSQGSRAANAPAYPSA